MLGTVDLTVGLRSSRWVVRRTRLIAVALAIASSAYPGTHEISQNDPTSLNRIALAFSSVQGSDASSERSVRTSGAMELGGWGLHAWGDIRWERLERSGYGCPPLAYCIAPLRVARMNESRLTVVGLGYAKSTSPSVVLFGRVGFAWYEQESNQTFQGLQSQRNHFEKNGLTVHLGGRTKVADRIELFAGLEKFAKDVEFKDAVYGGVEYLMKKRFGVSMSVRQNRDNSYGDIETSLGVTRRF